MSTAEILSLISTISFVVAAISLVFAIFFWFNFKIPSVIGDLSGRTARRSIARMRASNERAGGQGYKPSAANVDRGKLTDTMQHSRKLAADAKKQPEAEQTPADEKPTTKETAQVTELLTANKADVTQTEQTELLEGTETTSFLTDQDATAPLYEEPKASAKRTGGMKLVMLDEVMLIHTDEVIG